MSFKVAEAGMFTEDPDIVSDCLWTVGYMSDTSDDGIIDFVAST